MLYLIGLGLNTLDLSLKALEALKKSQEVFAEFYTSQNIYNLGKLEKLIGKEIKLLDREEVEEKEILIKNAKNKKVALLVPGDPLCATTHQALVHECKKNKIKCKVIHASSIFTAIADSGLNAYKFGRVVTIARGMFESIYRFIEKNLNAGLHTLLLLEIDMNAKEAMEILLKMEEKFRGGIFKNETFIIILERIGTEKGRAIAGKISKLLNFNFKDLPHSIIIPSKLDHMEKEFLNSFSIFLNGD